MEERREEGVQGVSMCFFPFFSSLSNSFPFQFFFFYLADKEREREGGRISWACALERDLNPGKKVKVKSTI